jgi:Polyketide cyclase / dehydrase and lipid transport
MSTAEEKPPAVHRASFVGRSVSASAVVAATPEQVFALLADPHRHHELDGSGSVRGAVSGPRRLALGDRFGMRMRIGLPYQTLNRVVELEPDRRIAWCHFARAIWRYELEPVDGGTLVTETFDYAGARGARGLELVGFPARNARAIDATLRRLQEFFPAASRGGSTPPGPTSHP